jgi:hypothetical protein
MSGRLIISRRSNEMIVKAGHRATPIDSPNHSVNKNLAALTVEPTDLDVNDVLHALAFRLM